jgi:hypothetical protein
MTSLQKRLKADELAKKWNLKDLTEHYELLKGLYLLDKVNFCRMYEIEIIAEAICLKKGYINPLTEYTKQLIKEHGLN